MCVETSLGKSERATIDYVVMQGSVTGGTLCSNQLSKLCNESYDEGIVYMYRGRIPIPALAMVDDVVSIALCDSIESIEQNVKTDEFVKRKKLESQVGEGKCQWLHRGQNPCRSSYTASGALLSQCDQYKYLGDYVSDGFDLLYKKRQEKAVGYSISCQAMCNEISLGYETFSIAKLLLQSIFLNGTLLNMETWPNFTDNRVMQFEKIEQGFLRRVLSAHSKTPIECLYLELGITPFRFHLMMRRIMYYHTVMNREDDELTKMILVSQKETKLKGDFYQQVSNDMAKLGITDNLILTSSKGNVKEILSENIQKQAFEYLMTKARNHSKVKHEAYVDLNGGKYFFDNRFTSQKAKLLFMFRTRMFTVRNNFRNNYSSVLCPLCGVVEDSQEHLFYCKIIQNYFIPSTSYDDIFSNDISCLLKVASELEEIVKIREELCPN